MAQAEHIERASFEAHMAAAKVIAEALGVERAQPEEVALALAEAFGDVMGICVCKFSAHGEPADAFFERIDAAHRSAADRMVSKIMAHDCRGSA